MIKIFCITLLVIASTALTDKEIIQQGLNGLFEENKLPDPTTIVSCIDDDTAHKIVVFAGQVLEKAAKGTVSDLLQLKKLFQDFGNQIPQPVKDCMDGNKELQALGLKYGIDNNTDSAALEKKIIAFVTLHYLELHKWLGDLNTLWKAGKYYQVGFNGAGYGHKVIGSAQLPEITDKEIIQQGLNGLFEENKLPDPTTIVPCIDDDTAHKIVVFAGQVLEKAAKGTVSDLLQLKKLFQDFGNQIPQPVKDCMDGNKELQALGLKYGIDNNTDSAALEKKIIAFVTLHYLELHKWLGDLNTLWKAGKYYQVGFNGAGYGHKVIGSAQLPEITDKEIIQQGLNGLFEENKLPDPTTIVPCIDDDTAHKIVVFAGQVLEKAAKGTVSDLLQLKKLFQDFGNQIPQPVKDCMDGNKELQALGLKYGIDNNTDSAALEKKIIAFVTLHYLELHKWLGDLNTLWKAGKYYQVGFNGAGYGHKVIGSAQLPEITDKEIIQQGLNGLFEENKLPDPTTIVPCIDDDTAHKIVVFAGQVLEKAAKGSVADLIQLIALIKGFGDQIPQSVKDCLNGNAEFAALGLKYGIDDTTDSTVIEKKVIAYVSLHYLQVHKWLVELNNNFKAGKYYQVGYDGATYGHKVLGLTIETIKQLRQ